MGVKYIPTLVGSVRLTKDGFMTLRELLENITLDELDKLPADKRIIMWVYDGVGKEKNEIRIEFEEDIFGENI